MWYLGEELSDTSMWCPGYEAFFRENLSTSISSTHYRNRLVTLYQVTGLQELFLRENALRSIDAVAAVSGCVALVLPQA
jgi:hypothetical protein